MTSHFPPVFTVEIYPPVSRRHRRTNLARQRTHHDQLSGSPFDHVRQYGLGEAHVAEEIQIEQSVVGIRKGGIICPLLRKRQGGS